MNKSHGYSQLRAMLGIMKASLISSSRNPASIVFGLIFPLIFIVVFGYIGGDGIKYQVAINQNAQRNNPIYQSLAKIASLTLKTDLTTDQIETDLAKGKLDAALDIQKIGVGQLTKFQVNLTTTSASPQAGQVILGLVGSVVDKVNLAAMQPTQLVATFSFSETTGRKLSSIDFILPGQLGFSLLTAGIFATAFVFLTLKQTLVIKRFFTTPVSKLSIILGEGLARLIFALIQGAVIVVVGYLVFDYTLINGWVTFGEIMVLAAIALIVFLGFGFVISSIAKDERTVPPLAQLITLPQFLLAGTFFPIETFPGWLQPIGRIMPLTFFNDAVRKVAFEGATLFQVGREIGFLVLWGVVVYALVVKIFKWE